MKPRLLRLLLLIGIPLLLLTICSGYIFEWMWLNELGYSHVFWTIRGTQVLLTLGAFAISALYLVANFRILADRLRWVQFEGTPLQPLNIHFGSAARYRQLRIFLTSAALFMALLFAAGFYLNWDDSLRFFWSESFGQSDPVFGREIGFYLFQLPFWKRIQISLSLLVFLMLALLLFIYLITGLLSPGDGRGEIRMRPDVSGHLRWNAVIWLLLLVWGVWLERYQLLLRPDGIVFGATYAHINVELPGLWVLMITLAGAALVLALGNRLNLRRILPVTAFTALAVLALGRVIIPSAVQQFSVEPNELELETPFLENNIRLTRLAYGLDKIREIEYEGGDTLTFEDIRRNQDVIDNIRLWDPRLLIQTYRQLQEIRSYYEFYSVDNDRYLVGDRVLQTMLASREIARNLPSQSDTWVNRHLQYTHGYGLVMNPVTETNRQGEPVFLIRDIPPVSPHPDLQIERPEIYYGENSSGYYVVNTLVPELNYPFGDQNVYTHYSGQGGIPIDSFWKKILFAWQLGDINLILSNYIHEESRLQIWRSVQERIRRITPFLSLDSDPYLVLNEGRLYWIQDAYTTSSHFPYSQPHGRFNYIRNSVKVVVDAYEGSVDYYIVDEEDPVLRVYRRIFPGLFQPLENLPSGLEHHFRYPQDLFEIQLEIFNRYHMTHPQLFYNQEDLWTRPNEKYAGIRRVMEPYYVLARLPGEERLEFMLISPTTPENRDNMIGWLAAKSDADNYGEMVVYRLPKDRLIYGPAQIDARIDQDPEISRQLALWDQRGSSVIRGNLMVIPVENSFLYVEPVFLLAEGVDIPQLQRVIVAIGDNVSMQPSIGQAIRELFGVSPDMPGPAALPAGGPQSGAEVPLLLQRESEELDEIRSLWQQMMQALDRMEWRRYGELMEELDKRLRDE